MEPGDALADLEALRKLYGLLQNSADTVQELDYRAKIVLKKLLDGATDKALETHTKISGAAQFCVSTGASNSSRFSVVPTVASPAASKNNIRRFPSENLKKDTNCYKFTPGNDLGSRRKQAAIAKRCEQRRSKRLSPTNASTKSGGGGGRFNGRVVQEERKSSEKRNQSKRRKRRTSQIRGKSKGVVNKFAPIDSGLSTEMDDFGKDVADAVKRIGSGVADLQAFSGNLANARQPERAVKTDGSRSSRNNINKPNNKAPPLVKQQPVQLSRRLSGSSHCKAAGFPGKSLNNNNPVLPPKMVQNQAVRKPAASARIKMPPLRVIMRPTLLDLRSSESSKSESDGSASSARSWRTQQSYTEETYSDRSVGNSVGTSFASGSSASSYYKTNSDSETERSNSSSSGTSRSRGNPKDSAVGRLRRFKNKMALIFHHHHHHHHHYDHDHNDQPKKRTDMKKHLHDNETLDHKEQKKGKQQADNRLSRYSKQEQENCFHTLVKGLRRRVRHSKTSKLSKGGISVKKLHWWQMIKSRSGPRPRPKLGPRSKTIRFK